MQRNRLPANRTTQFAIIGAVLAALLILVIIDPTFQLLAWLGVFVVLTVILSAFWTKRQTLLAWHRQFRPSVRGLLAGCVAWLFCCVWSFTVQSGLVPLPDAIRYSPFFGLFSSICAVLALPVEMGGWFFVWGDNGPPDCFPRSIILTILPGVFLNALLGAILFSVVHRFKKS